MAAQLVLDRVRLALLGEDLLLLNLELRLIPLNQGSEQRRHLANTFDDDAHVLLQRLERRLAEQRRHGVGG